MADKPHVPCAGIMLFCRTCCFCYVVAMPPKSHESKRTTAEWVAWAKHEGFVDIEESCGEVAQHAKVCIVFFFDCGIVIFHSPRFTAHCVVPSCLQRTPQTNIIVWSMQLVLVMQRRS